MDEAQNNFLRSVVPAARESMRLFGVPASVTIAQAILESGWGRSSLAKKYNNYFGIKDTDFHSYVECPTTEIVSGVPMRVDARFETYPSVDKCFIVHARLLAMQDRYGPAMAAKSDPQKFAGELQVCGYSTNPGYGAMLRKLMAQFDLEQFDNPPDGPAQAEAAA